MGSLFLVSFCCFSVSMLCPTLRPHGLQHTRLPCPSLSPRVCPNKYLLSQWCHLTSHPLSSPSPPASNPSQHQSLYQWVNSLHEVAKVASFLPKNTQDWSPRGVVIVNTSIKFSWVPRLCPNLCDPMACSMPGFPVYHQLLELSQTHVHWVSDAIQPSHPLSPLSPPAFNLS